MNHQHANARRGERHDEIRSRLSNARLYVIVDAQTASSVWEERIKSLLRGGVDVIQLRDKELADRPLLARARRLRELTLGSGTLMVMNDRADLATLSDADGVHVGQDELTVPDARSIVGPEMLIGVSTHSIDQALQAVQDGADYIGVGPTFPSPTKHFDTFPGLDLLRGVADQIRIPAFAIGGIRPDNLSAVLATGFRRIAVSRVIQDSDNPSAVARRIQSHLAATAPSSVECDS